MGWQEHDLTKHSKIHYLRLTSVEWICAGQFTDLLLVCMLFSLCECLPDPFFLSMLTWLSRHSCQMQGPHYTLQSWHWKKLTSIMRRQQSLYHMSWLWVCPLVVVYITVVNFRILKYSTLQANWPTSRKTGQRAFKKRFLLVQNKLYVKLCFVYLFISDKYKSLKCTTLKWIDPHQHHEFMSRREKQAVSRNSSTRLEVLMKMKILEIPYHRLCQIQQCCCRLTLWII